MNNDFNFTSSNYETLTESEKRMFSLQLRDWLTKMQMDELECKDLRKSFELKNKMRRVFSMIKKVESIDYAASLYL